MGTTSDGLEQAMTFDSIKLSPQKEIVRTFYKDMWDHAAIDLIPAIFHEDFTFRGSLGPVLVGHDAFADYVRWVTRHPNFHLLSIVVRNAEVGGPQAPALADLIAAAEQAALGDDAQRDAHLAAWAEAYRAFNANANRTPCSAAALLKRIRKDRSLPRIYPLVDAYNAVSVLYGVPVGGEDLDHYQGLPRLLIATGAEPFDTVQRGEPVTEHPEPKAKSSGATTPESPAAAGTGGRGGGLW